MRYVAVVEQGSESWGAYVPDLPGCIAVGESRDEVVQLIKEAVALHLEGLNANGEPIPTPSSQIEYVDVSAA